ncbi:F-box protein At3g07870 isoform X1 [Prunus avium]|uniref:F-box protein At3g07870 isoform X1 n=1 Tax=Prunus avium TaxID=42229 RepID=A0A6P5TS83_PRUAV|nr:F-box protein At3g07870 isoform X1 [Prunus avium]
MDSDSELQMRRRRRRRSNQREDQPVLGMENLPYEIVVDIISRLPFSSLVQFRYVCRAWRNLAQDQHNLESLDHFRNSNTADENSYLCLIFHCDYPIRNHLCFVDYPFHHCGKEAKIVRKIHTPFSGLMPEFDVVGSCNGLLCLSDSLYNDALYIYNPFTRDYRELPKSIQFPNQEVIYGFGFHPVTKEYKVVKIVYYRNAHRGSWHRFRVYRPQSEVQVLTLGSSNWRSIGKTSHYLHHWPAQVLVNGRLHWVTWRRRYHPGRKLISFDLGDEQFREVPKPEADGLNRWDYHLLVVRSCLAAVFYCSFGKLEMWVMKEYGVKEAWVKELNIASHVPKALKQDVDRSWKISKIAIRGRYVRVLCVLGSGQILLEYKSRALVLYDPNGGNFQDLVFQGMPKWFQTVVHLGRLNQIHTLVNM